MSLTLVVEKIGWFCYEEIFFLVFTSNSNSLTCFPIPKEMQEKTKQKQNKA